MCVVFRREFNSPCGAFAPRTGLQIRQSKRVCRVRARAAAAAAAADAFMRYKARRQLYQWRELTNHQGATGNSSAA